MDGITYLKDYCKKNQINPDEILKLGRGTNGPEKKSKRYKFIFKKSATKDTLLYAVQYCKDINLYIAWKFTGRHNLSVKADEIIFPVGEKVCSVKKHVTYSGWGEELVLYFQKEGIPDFIERYIKPYSNSSETPT